MFCWRLAVGDADPRDAMRYAWSWLPAGVTAPPKAAVVVVRRRRHAASFAKTFRWLVHRPSPEPSSSPNRATSSNPLSLGAQNKSEA